MVKVSHFRLLILLGVGVLLFLWFGFKGGGVDNRKELRVLSYSSFVADWGAGGALSAAFFDETGYSVRFVDSGSGAMMLNKFNIIQRGSSPVDVVLGFNTMDLPVAVKNYDWHPLPSHAFPFSPFHSKENFLAVSKAPLSFVTRQYSRFRFESLSDLTEKRFQKEIVLIDPRTSALGSLFYFWLIDSMGEEKALHFLDSLRPSIHSVVNSWSLSYGLFKMGRVGIVLSYLTSPVYHWIEEDDYRYNSIVFALDMPFHIDYVGIPNSCQNCELAREFVKFLFTDKAQKIIMKKNYVLPTVDVKEGTLFENLPLVQPYVWKDIEGLAKSRERLLEQWVNLGL